MKNSGLTWIDAFPLPKHKMFLIRLILSENDIHLIARLSMVVVSFALFLPFGFNAA
jgi:hypothetical protein